MFGAIRKVFMEEFVVELALGKEMVMRGKSRQIRGDIINKGRGRRAI